MSNSVAYYVPHGTKWPFFLSSGLFFLALGLACFLNDFAFGPYLMLIGLGMVFTLMFLWFAEVARESEANYFNHQVGVSFRMGMFWFIFSEVMFFASFFGALFYLRNLAVPWLAEADILWPNYGGGWPTAGPLGPTLITPDTAAMPGEYSTISSMGLPLLNTIILLTSSVTITIAHWGLKMNRRGVLIGWMAVTVLLGVLFLYYQSVEYIHAYQELGLTFATGVYGGTFFMLTGFHGFHVTIGTIILAIITYRCCIGHFSAKNHFAFEAAAWYWHFVDTVWVGLFIFVYIL